MPPKKAAAKEKEEKGPVEVIPEEPIQAVVLADSFNRRFEVLCVDKPRCLLPLLGIPLLAWTLESLSLSNVSEVFIFCGVHAAAIKDYVHSSHYAKTLTIEFITSQSAISPGDALRQLDGMAVLNAKSPFILIHSPIVSSFDLSKVVRAHKERREADKNVIMTLAIGTGGRTHPESPLMLVNPTASTLMHYSQLPSLPRKNRFPIPTSLLMDRSDPRSIAYEVWGGKGYRDLGIDVCEADVPALCTENFDWQDLRRHLVCGILSSQEMLGKKVGVYLVGGENGEKGGDIEVNESRTYVERIRDTRTFGDVSRDVLRRWAYPLVPDSGIQGASDFEQRRGGIYVAREGVVLARTTSLIGPLLLGPYTSLGSNTTIRRSVLGRNNRVAAHSSICDAYLFDNVIIGKNCRVEGCILGEGVVLEDGATVEKGALLGSGVRVGQGQTVEAFARVGKTTAMTMKMDDSDEESEDDDIEGMIPLPGDSSVGYIWPTEDNELESDDELEDPYEHPDNKRLLELGRSLDDLSLDSASVSTLSAASETETDKSMDSENSEDVDALILGGRGISDDFRHEAYATLDHSLEEGHAVEDATTNFKTLMLDNNANRDGEIGPLVMDWLMKDIHVESRDAKTVTVEINREIERKGRLGAFVLRMLLHSPFALVSQVQEYSVAHPEHKPYFNYFLKAIWQSDAVEADQIVDWFTAKRTRGADVFDEDLASELKALWEKSKVFVVAMQQAEEESESESGDADEDSD